MSGALQQKQNKNKQRHTNKQLLSVQSHLVADPGSACSHSCRLAPDLCQGNSQTHRKGKENMAQRGHPCTQQVCGFPDSSGVTQPFTVESLQSTVHKLQVLHQFVDSKTGHVCVFFSGTPKLWIFFWLPIESYINTQNRCSLKTRKHKPRVSMTLKKWGHYQK